MISYDEITNKKKLNFKDVGLESAAIYSCEDVYITNRLFKKQVKAGVQEIKVLHEIEIPLLEVLVDMEVD